MNKTQKGFGIGQFLIQLSVFTIILYFLHRFIIQSYFDALDFYFEVWKIYAFQFLAVAILIYFLNHRSKIQPTKVFNTFVILSMIKMFAVIIFLLPLFLNKSVNPRPSVFAFFIAYFVFLIFETSHAVKILNKKK